jgi:2,5-diketo-D-gluconate reductase A
VIDERELTGSARLNDGVLMPRVGMGVYLIEDSSPIEEAVRLGYRHLDTAVAYGNEELIGEVLQRSGVARSEMFVATKVPIAEMGFDETIQSCNASLSRLKADYIDLLLIHWPAPANDRYVETWKALIRLRDEGKVRSIGVSNFNAEHLDRIVAETSVVPSVNQIEIHPAFQQAELRAKHEVMGIVTVAWRPLAHGAAIGSAQLLNIATKLNVSVSQVILRWHLQIGNAIIPKSANAERLRQNLNLGGFQLDDDDMDAIAHVERGERTGPDPELTNE